MRLYNSRKTTGIILWHKWPDGDRTYVSLAINEAGETFTFFFKWSTSRLLVRIFWEGKVFLRSKIYG